MLGDNIVRSNTLGDVSIAVFYSLAGVVLGLVILGIALTTASYTQIEFPLGNDGMYGFLMKSVQTRIPLASSGGVTVNAPLYNPNYEAFGVSPGAPINMKAYYNHSAPFSTSAWWSRLASQKSPTAYTPAMPSIYCGTFNLYRSKATPSFAVTVARPYSMGNTPIKATSVCGQELPSTYHSTSYNISDTVPTCFTAPALWNTNEGRPYIIPSEISYSVRENGNMTAQMDYVKAANNESLRISLTQMTPYIVYTLSPGSAMTINQFYRDSSSGGGSYQTIKLINVMATGPPPLVLNDVSHMYFKTEIIPTWIGDGHLPPVGLSQTSIVTFQMVISPPAVSVIQLADYTVIITTDPLLIQPTTLTLLPDRYYIATPNLSPLDPTDWVRLDSLVAGSIFQTPPVQSLRAFVSATSRNRQAVLTYTSDFNQPIFFVPSLSMLTVGTISGAVPVPSLPSSFGANYWLSPQGPTSVFVASSGRFDVAYSVIDPPRFGLFDIYPSFDANSLKRMSFIFNRDLEALYAIDVPNDPFYVSVKKIFTFAQYTYAVNNFPAQSLVNVLLPPLRTHLAKSLLELIESNREEIRLGFNSNLFTVAAGSQEYGASQNQAFGDNHVGQYGMILFTYYILVSIQYDNTSRRYMRDLYQSVMIDIMRDFAQPYTTDQFIPSMRHFDYGTGISSQTSSIIEQTSLQVSEVVNGYYACWLVASLFGDVKLRDYYKAILSIEMATHQQYRLAPLNSRTEGPINQMILAADKLFENCTNKEYGLESPASYKTFGTTVFLIQGGEIVMHAVRNDHPDYKYLVDNIAPNTVADFSTISFYRPITPLTVHIIPLAMGINLNSFQSVVFAAAYAAESSHAFSNDIASGTPIRLLSLESSPASFMTIEAAYSQSPYAVNYVTNYTWPGANLPAETCAIIAASDLPPFLAPFIQYNKLGFSESNTILWIQFVISAYGPR